MQELWEGELLWQITYLWCELLCLCWWWWWDLEWWSFSFKDEELEEPNPFLCSLVFCRTRRYDSVQSQHNSFPSTFRKDILKLRKTFRLKQQLCITPTFLLPSSLRSKAHCCLHCSHVCGGPYFFSELVQRWHLVPMKAAMMLQYWHGLGCKTNAHETNALWIQHGKNVQEMGLDNVLPFQTV